MPDHLREQEIEVLAVAFDAARVQGSLWQANSQTGAIRSEEGHNNQRDTHLESLLSRIVAF